MKRIFLGLSVAGLLLAGKNHLAASDAKPLPVVETRSTTARFLAKPVLESRLLDGMESSANWSHHGPGDMAFSTKRRHEGAHSLRLTSPTKTDRPGPVSGRPFAESVARRDFAGADWSAFNRVSVWVYPDLPGFHHVSILLKLHSEGTRGRSYTDGALHYALLTNRAWNRVVWEIPHLERTRVEALELIYRLQGNEPGATERVQFDLDQLELQRVEADAFRGWAPAPGRIVYCHTGYEPGAPKVALAAVDAGDTFQLLDAASGKSVWQRAATQVETPTGAFRQLDFSAFKQPGRYRLKIGAVSSEVFPIGDGVWRESLLAALNFFYAERCGGSIPGVHDVCHRDWQVKHGGQRLPINGGWHDAGDLSQGLVNTSEAAWSMLHFAEAAGENNATGARFADEARWGLDWMLKTRFGDGHRVTWATMDFWTDGVPGNADDVVVDSSDAAFDNFLAAAAEAAAGREFRDRDPAPAQRALDAAEADWRFALAKVREPRVELAAAGAQAGLELFRATGREEFAVEAKRFAEVLLASQQTEPTAWDIPMSGFFYTSPRKERFLHYNHRSHEQAPVVALADLCDALPDDPARPQWLAAVRRFGDHLLATAKFTEPYRMLPAGIYRLDQAGNDFDRQQIQNGIRLADGIFLRRFPVWGDMRGNLGVQLSRALTAARAARLLKDTALAQLAREQLEWTLGRNPFAQSLMYGVGHNYAPQYTPLCGNLAGSLPVGIQSRLTEDVPYWPAANCYNYAEIWVHPVSRWIAALAELRGW